MLAASSQQVAPVSCPPRCPGFLSLGENSLSKPGASENLGNEPAWAQDGKRARDHDLVTSELNVLNNPSTKMKRKRHPASRRSVNNFPETKLTNAEMKSVGPATRQSYTAAHDAFAAWARTQQLQLRADPATLDRVFVRHLDEELFAGSESATVARMALFGMIYCRGVPRHPHIMGRCRRAPRGFIRDEPGFSKDTLPLEALVILTSDLLKQHRLMDNRTTSSQFPTSLPLKLEDTGQCQSFLRRA